MALSITFTSLPEAEEQTSSAAWLAATVANPASVTWDVRDSQIYYSARDTATGFVVHVQKTGTPTSVDLAHRNDEGRMRMFGPATGENFVPLQTHLAGLV